MFYYLIEKIFYPIYKNKVSDCILNLIEDNSKILDLGCGKGLISKNFKNVVRTDIQKNKNVKNFLISSAEFLPFKDKSFDVTILVDVLHHTDNLISILKEIKRVTKKNIIIKDHAFINSYQKFLVHVGDRLTNSFKCKTFNHLNYNFWLDIFKNLELEIEEEPKKLNFGFFLNEKMNPIWKLKIKN